MPTYRHLFVSGLASLSLCACQVAVTPLAAPGAGATVAPAPGASPAASPGTGAPSPAASPAARVNLVRRKRGVGIDNDGAVTDGVYLPEGDPGTDDVTARAEMYPGAEYIVPLATISKVQHFQIQASGAYDYEIAVSALTARASDFTRVAPVAAGGGAGLRTRTVSFGAPVDAFYVRVRITTPGAMGFLSELEVYAPDGPAAPAAGASPVAAASPASPASPAMPVPSGPPASPVQTAPPAAGTGPSAQKPFRFDSNSQSPGVLGKVRLELGKRTFKATHTGKDNFILYVSPDAPNAAPQTAFNEIGAGSWTWTYQVQQAGDYIVDLKDADGEWTLTIE